MTVLLGALVFLGRALLILLAVVLVAAALLLVVPVGLSFRWTPAVGAVVQACIGPVRHMLYPRRKKKQKKPSKPAPPKSGAGESKAAEPAAPAPADASPAEQPATPGPSAEPKAGPAPGPAPAAGEPDPELPLPPLTDIPQDELAPDERDALLGAGKVFFQTMAPHRARLLRGVQVRHLTVFWTVTGEDAADTAVAYGRRMALANNLLGVAKQFLSIRADSLRMEPDFTGQMAEKRIFSCQIQTRPYIILLILFYLMRRDGQGKTPLNLILDQLGALA